MPEIQTFTPSDLEIALRHCCVCQSVMEARISFMGGLLHHPRHSLFSVDIAL